jgi:MFS family permease
VPDDRRPLTARLAGRLGPVGERDFGCFWLGRTLSLVGDYAFRVAFITYVIDVGRSATTLAVANAALLLPALAFYLLGGAVGDRVASRRHILIVTDLARFAATAGIALAAAGHGALVAVVALALLIGVGDGFFGPAALAYVPEIVRPDQLVAANSANSIGQQIGLVVGPLAGGLLVGFGSPALAFGFDAASFLASALLIMAVRHRPAPATEPAGPDAGAAEPAGSLLADVAGGLRYALTQRWLLISFAVGASANAVFAGNLDVTVPFIVSPDGLRGASELGGFYAMQGVGALVGAVILARLRIHRVGELLFGMLTMMGTALALVGVFGAGAGSYLMALAYGVGVHFFNSLFLTLLQEKVPSALMSRVSSVVLLAFTGLMPLGTLLMGPLVAGFGATHVVLATGAGIAAICLAAAFAPSIRALTLSTGTGTTTPADTGPEAGPAAGPMAAGPADAGLAGRPATAGEE